MLPEEEGSLAKVRVCVRFRLLPSHHVWRVTNMRCWFGRLRQSSVLASDATRRPVLPGEADATCGARMVHEPYKPSL